MESGSWNMESGTGGEEHAAGDLDSQEVAGAILSVPGTSEAFPCYCDDGTYVGDFSTVRACAAACYPA